jgi:hypothetical protein
MEIPVEDANRAAHKQATTTYGTFGFDISTKPARSKGARDESETN